MFGRRKRRILEQRFLASALQSSDTLERRLKELRKRQDAGDFTAFSELGLVLLTLALRDDRYQQDIDQWEKESFVLARILATVVEDTVAVADEQGADDRLILRIMIETGAEGLIMLSPAWYVVKFEELRALATIGNPTGEPIGNPIIQSALVAEEFRLKGEGVFGRHDVTPAIPTGVPGVFDEAGYLMWCEQARACGISDDARSRAEDAKEWADATREADRSSVHGLSQDATDRRPPDRSSSIEEVSRLMQAGRFAAALPLLLHAIEQDSSEWNAEYLAGQCCRFLNDPDGAVDHLSRAAALQPEQPQVFLALGIAHQSLRDWGAAIEALERATDLDPDYDLAYNSLALTQKQSGKLEEALHTYDAGAKALTRGIVGGMQSDSSNQILKHRETVGHRWLEYATYGCTHLAAHADGITSIGWPTGAAAQEEERTERHRGLYWVDREQDDGGTLRFFLPNYFNTFREGLRDSGSYANLIGNRGTVLGLLGHDDEAEQHFQEATEFSRTP